jgi:hypothetical protein
MRSEKMVIEVKNAGKWIVENTIENLEEIYSSLSADLIAKKINACTYIKSIKRVCNYDGTQNIIVNFGNGARRVYTVKD